MCCGGSQGKDFYVDHHTRTTHWQLPPGLRVVGDPDKAPHVGDDTDTAGGDVSS